MYDTGGLKKISIQEMMDAMKTESGVFMARMQIQNYKTKFVVLFENPNDDRDRYIFSVGPQLEWTTLEMAASFTLGTLRATSYCETNNFLYMRAEGDEEWTHTNIGVWDFEDDELPSVVDGYVREYIEPDQCDMEGCVIIEVRAFPSPHSKLFEVAWRYVYQSEVNEVTLYNTGGEDVHP